MTAARRLTRRMRTDEVGASAVEYGLIIGAIAAVIVAIVFMLGRVTQGAYQTTCDNWDTAAGTSDC